MKLICYRAIQAITELAVDRFEAGEQYMGSHDIESVGVTECAVVPHVCKRDRTREEYRLPRYQRQAGDTDRDIETGLSFEAQRLQRDAFCVAANENLGTGAKSQRCICCNADEFTGEILIRQLAA